MTYPIFSITRSGAYRYCGMVRWHTGLADLNRSLARHGRLAMTDAAARRRFGMSERWSSSNFYAEVKR